MTDETLAQIGARLAVLESVVTDLLSENAMYFVGGASAAVNAIERLACRTCPHPDQCRLSGCYDKQVGNAPTPTTSAE